MIEIVDYRDAWPTEFDELARDIRSALGSLALRVDHIGSTAVPGLCAKDVIDVQVALASLDDEPARRLSAAGFVARLEITADHVPPGCLGSPLDWQKRFCMQRPGQRRAHIHLRVVDHPNYRFALLFRDYLRAHGPTAMAYGELKRRLAASLANEADYPTVKDPAVDLIYFAAEQWAAQTRWQPSDAVG